MRTDFAVRYPGLGGMDGSRDSSLLDGRFVASSVNVESRGQLLATRCGVKVHDLSPVVPDGANFQGAVHYNPAQGQSQQSFGADRDGILMVAAGRKFFVVPSQSRPVNTKLEITEVTGGLVSDESLHLVWVFQAENYVIVQDEVGKTWVWDGETSPFFSSGYNVVDKEESKLANAASVGLYAHGRIIQVVNGKQLLVGDIIHKSELSKASNILEMTEQTYWATGSFFSPPSDMGRAVAGGVLPIRNTAHGHGEVMLHCQNGVFSLDLNVYPRSDWADRQMVRTALLGTGAAGPYALTRHNDGDQIFRSRHGIQTLRSAAAESAEIGNPIRPISEEVREWTDGDYKPYLRFSSIASWAERNRLIATVEHGTIGGKHRGGRGLISQNYTPLTSDVSRPVWEGLWTLPPEAGLVGQLVNDLFSGEDRLFALATGLKDEKIRLVEFSKDLRDDVLPDGSKRRIECQVISRELTGGDEMTFKTYDNATLYLRDVEGDLDWEVMVRTDQSPCWETWISGQHRSEAAKEEDALESPEVANLDIGLGTMPSEMQRNRRLQVMVKWTGRASLEGLELRYSPDSSGEGELGKTRTYRRQVCKSRFNAFSYHDGN